MAKTQPNPFLEKLQFSKDGRVQQENNWYANQMYLEHDRIFKTSGKKLLEVNPEGINRHIAMARKMARDLRNTVTKNDPRRDTKEIVYEGSYDEVEVDVACALLQDTFRKNHMKTKIKDMLYHSFLKGIAFMEVYTDENSDIQVDTRDTFDIYLDRYARLEGSYIKARRIIKACKQPTSVMKLKYPEHTFQSDTKQAESDMKSSIITMDEQTTNSTGDLGTTMIYELMYMEGDTVQRETIDTNGVLIEKVDLGISEYPIVAYQPERMGGKIYPVPRINPVIELNKSYDKTFSAMEEFVRVIAKGRMAVPKGSKMTHVTGSNGQVITYDKVPPTFIQPTSPGDAPFALMAQMQKHIEDTGGVHSESAGRLSSASVRSGVQVSQIQMGDVLNVSEPVDNLEDFLSCVGEIILSLASKNFTSIKKIFIKQEETQVIGEEGKGPMEKLGTVGKDVVRIKPFKNIKVEILPGSAYSNNQARNDVMSLIQAGVKIPEEVIIDIFKFGNTRDIINKMRMEEDKNKSPDVEIANGENKKMLLGQRVMANQTDDHRIHKAIHATLLQGLKDNPQIAQLVMSHIKEHEVFAGGMSTQTPTPQTTPTPSPQEETPMA